MFFYSYSSGKRSATAAALPFATENVPPSDQPLASDGGSDGSDNDDIVDDDPNDDNDEELTAGTSTATAGSSSKRARTVLPRKASNMLKTWLFTHFRQPYPAGEERQQLAENSGLKPSQLKRWFTNARRRLLPSKEANWRRTVQKELSRVVKATDASSVRLREALQKYLEEVDQDLAAGTWPPPALQKTAAPVVGQACERPVGLGESALTGHIADADQVLRG